MNLFSICSHRTRIDKAKKLETRWEGPCKVTRVTKTGVSAILEDLCTGMRRGRYAVDDVKLYIARDQETVPNGYMPVALVGCHGALMALAISL